MPKIREIVKITGQTLLHHKKYSFLVISITLLASLLETAGLGMILPLLQTIIDSGRLDPAQSSGFVTSILQKIPVESRVQYFCIFAACLIFAKTLCLIAKVYFTLRFAAVVRSEWAHHILEGYLKHKTADLIKQKQGKSINNVVTEPGLAAKALRNGIDLALHAIMCVSVLTLLLCVEFKLTIAILAIATCIILPLGRISNRYSLSVGQNRLRYQQEVTATAAESIAGIRQIKYFSKENWFVDLFTEKIRYLAFLVARHSTIKSIPHLSIEVIIVLLALAVWGFYSLHEEPNMSDFVPMLVMFAIAAQRLFSNFTSLLSKGMVFLAHYPSLKLVTSMVMENRNYKPLVSLIEPPDSPSKISFRDVSFRYADDENGSERALVLSGLFLEFQKGTVCAITGPSGSGKSTVCDLLAGLLDCNSGEIKVDGFKLDSIDRDLWRKKIGFVSQEVFLFNTTIRENILMSKENASDEELLEACTKAQCHDFILSLPKGYDTMLGERGGKLSGGQRQRIAIARALLRNPAVIILDEATNAIDVASTKKILNMLHEIKSDMVVILVTHQSMVVDSADVVFNITKSIPD